MLIKLKTTALISFFATMLFTVPAIAKDQKIGIVDFQAIARQLPQMASIQQKIADEFKTQIEEVKKLQDDAKYSYDKLQREGATLSNSQKEELKNKIMSLQKTIEEKGQPLKRQMQARGQEEERKIFEKVQKATDAIAKQEGFNIILQKNVVAFIDDLDATDISEKVIEKVSKN